MTGEATFTFERNSSVYTEEAKYRPASGGVTRDDRFIELTVTGTQIGSGDNQTLKIDLAGQWTAWGPLSAEEEGNSLEFDVEKGPRGPRAVNVRMIEA